MNNCTNCTYARWGRWDNPEQTKRRGVCEYPLPLTVARGKIVQGSSELEFLIAGIIQDPVPTTGDGCPCWKQCKEE